jgi:hypothetical protein
VHHPNDPIFKLQVGSLSRSRSLSRSLSLSRSRSLSPISKLDLNLCLCPKKRALHGNLSFNVTYQAVKVKGQVAEEWCEYWDWNECGGILTPRLEAVDAAEGVQGKDVLS